MISSKALGLIFLFITSAAWIGASFITQALVSRSEQTEAALEPWLLTLICSSTLMLYLPIGHFARKRARYEGRVTRAARSPRPRTRHRKGPTVVASDDVALEHAGCLLPRRRVAAAAAAAVVESTGADADDVSDDDGVEGTSDAELGPLGRARSVRGSDQASGAARASSRGLERQPLLQTHKHHHTPHSHPHVVGCSAGSEAPAGIQTGVMVGGDAEGVEASGDGGEVDTTQIVRAAFMVAPVWFAAQLAFTASLEFTSVTSNTVLSSCSSLFVYLGSLALGQEVGSALRFASVIAAMAGTTLVAVGDKRNENIGSSGSDGGGRGGSDPLFGDALTLIAAALYALYTLMMKRLLVKDDAIVMALFFGTIGLLYFSVLAPLAGTLALVGAPVIRRVTSRVLGLALVQGLIDYVAADYAWARAVMLLGPTATSCGLAMQIPAAGIIDAMLNGKRLSWSESPGSLVQFLVGSFLIICGFIGVSIEPRVVSTFVKRCCACWGGHLGGTSGVGACPEGEPSTEVSIRSDGDRPDWDSTHPHGVAPSVMHDVAAPAGQTGSGLGEQHTVRVGSSGDASDSRRVAGPSRGSGGGAGCGSGSSWGEKGSGGKGGKGLLRGITLSTSGVVSTADLQSYIPLSNTAAGNSHVTATGRGQANMTQGV